MVEAQPQAVRRFSIRNLGREEVGASVVLTITYRVEYARSLA